MRTRVLMLFAAALTRGAISSALTVSTWYYASVPQEPKHEKGKQDKI